MDSENPTNNRANPLAEVASKTKCTRKAKAVKKSSRKAILESNGDSEKSDSCVVSFRMTKAERDGFQKEADRLGVALSVLFSIRLAATSGLTLAMIEIEKMRRTIDHTAQEFAVVQPQLDDMWAYIQSSDRAINKLSDDVRAGEFATRLLSDRLTDVARARDEAGDMVERLELIQMRIDEPAQEVAASVERLADMLADLKSGE